MTPDELALWRAQAEYLRANWSNKTNTVDPCFDCTLAFSDEMRAVGRCNGTPGEAIPVPRLLPIGETRRKNNRECQQRYRERHRDEIRERRRAYFAERWRKRFEVDEQATGAA